MNLSQVNELRWSSGGFWKRKAGLGDSSWLAQRFIGTSKIKLKLSLCWKLTWYFKRTEQKALSRKEIIESVRDSLKNLQLDYIDLLIVHKNDPNCPLEGKNLKFDNMLSRRAQEKSPRSIPCWKLNLFNQSQISLSGFSFNSIDIYWRLTFYLGRGSLTR